ncbi:MAG: VOC family protein [Casimicrobiaceae bacterium]
MADDTPLGCTGLARVELVVSDLERSARFYGNVVGLTPVGGETGTRAFAVGQEGAHLVLRTGPTAGCSLVAWWLAHDADLDRLVSRLTKAGVPFERTPRDVGAPTLQFVDAIGGLMSFEVPRPLCDQPSFEVTHTRIERIGHVVFKTPQADAAIAQAQEWLDFKLSDWIDDGTAFLRPALSAFHHGLGIARGASPGLHHVNFMVTEIDDIGRALHRLSQQEVPIVFGPGRHPISDSVFLYFLDPDGLTLEYSFGMETFPAHGARAARAWPPAPTSVDLWGSPRHPDLGRMGALIGGEAIGSLTHPCEIRL